MFRALKNPFSTPSDPKLTFRASHVPRLYSETIAPDDLEYWSAFYSVFDSAYDVLNLIQSADITRTLQAYPQNLVTLVNILSDRVEALLRDDAFPGKPKHANAGLAAYTTALLSKESVEERQQDPSRQMLNCLRVLGRVIPFMLAQEESNMEDDVFWTAKSTSATQDASEGPSPFVIDDEEEQNGDSSSAGASKLATPERTTPPLAERLLSMAVDLLFINGFTLPHNGQDGGSKISYTIWENGIGSTVSLPVNPTIDSNRTEVLRFLLVLISKTLYIPSNAYSMPGFSDSSSHAAINRWHAFLVKTPNSAKSRKIVLSLLCSLLNTSLKSGAYYANNAGGIVGTVGGAVGDSYEKLVSGGKRKEDPPRLGLVKIAVQVLNIILCTPTQDTLQAFEQRRNGDVGDFRSPPPTPSPGPNASFSSFMTPQGSSQGASEGNSFRLYLSKLHRGTDIGFIIENLVVILLQPMSTSLLKLPFEAVGASARASPTLATDFLILLWRLMDSIPNFAAGLLDNGKNAHHIMVILIYLCLEYKDDPSQIGLVKLCAFLLQTISAERSFGSSLNTALNTRIPLPSKYSIPGSAGDFLVQQIYSLIFSTHGSLNAIYPAFILTITNISPYLKNPSIRSSTRLVQLFMAMSNANFLLSDEANPRLVYYLLEAFNNIIQFQLSDCPNLVYSMIRSHARFEELATFTVAGGVASIRRARKERSGLPDSSDKTPRRLSTASEHSVAASVAPLATPVSERGNPLPALIEDEEKAALMQREQEQEQQRERGSQPTTPTAEYPPRQNQAGRILSEKAAGKLPMRSNSQLTLHSNAGSHMDSDAGEGEETQFIAKNGFVPTESWVASWREGLPIDSILILVSECLPKVSSLSSLSTSTAVIEYLRSVTLVGLLPPSSPVKSRRFTQSLHSTIWLMSLAWGNIFVHSLEVAGAGVWRDTNVKLLNVRQKYDRSGVQAVMSSLVEQGLGMLSLGGTSAGVGSGSNGASSPNRARRSTNRSRSSSNAGGVV